MYYRKKAVLICELINSHSYNLCRTYVSLVGFEGVISNSFLGSLTGDETLNFENQFVRKALRGHIIRRTLTEVKALSDQ